MTTHVMTSSRLPVIGVTPLVDKASSSYWIPPAYLHALEAAGAAPVILPLTHDPEVLADYAKICDGFLLTGGGHDISPRLYGEEPLPQCEEVSKERDLLDASIFRIALSLDRPLLGISRGMQFINVMLGGTLYQDLATQFKSNIDHRPATLSAIPNMTVNIVKDTPLHDLLKVDTLKICNSHHQGIKKLSPDLKVMATAEDGLIEAVYVPERQFIWGVQWHPEYDYRENMKDYILFQELVRKSR